VVAGPVRTTNIPRTKAGEAFGLIYLQTGRTILEHVPDIREVHRELDDELGVETLDRYDMVVLKLRNVQEQYDLLKGMPSSASNTTQNEDLEKSRKSIEQLKEELKMAAVEQEKVKGHNKQLRDTIKAHEAYSSKLIKNLNTTKDKITDALTVKDGTKAMQGVRIAIENLTPVTSSK